MEKFSFLVDKLKENFIILLRVERLNNQRSESKLLIENIANEINNLGFWVSPVIVDDQFNILERQELYEAALLLNLKMIPVFLGNHAKSEYIPERQALHVDKRDLEDFDFSDSSTLRCRIPLLQLTNPSLEGLCITLDSLYPSRVQKLKQDYHFFVAKLGIESTSAWTVDFTQNLSNIPHTYLRQMLSMDPSMAALMSGLPCSIALGRSKDSPFRLKDERLLLVAPHLLASRSALAVASRWGIEGVIARQSQTLDAYRLAGLFRHGAYLLEKLPLSDKFLLLNDLPEPIAFQLCQRKDVVPSSFCLNWMAQLLGVKADSKKLSAVHLAEACQTFEGPLEDLLISNGDSRLEIEPKDGKNRYGVPPRPRPEAVHFSSSTASSISDYGFFYCNLLRWDILNQLHKHDSDLGFIHSSLSDGIISELRDLCRIAEDEADGILAPSGTDTEVLAVLLSRAADLDKPFINILIAPAETGRGVELAAAGRYFDSKSATGASIEKGSEIWTDADIQVISIQIRSHDGDYLPPKKLDKHFLEAGRCAIESGAHILLHLLLGSKTGLEGPSEEAVETLVAHAPERVDVVVDACQMRVDFIQLGSYIKRGWMVQLSGSKSLTGPPFSGALLFPTKLRSRLGTITQLMRPGIGYPEDWSRWWSKRLEKSNIEKLTFGAAFRWLPALLEAKLIRNVSEVQCEKILKRFQHEVKLHLDNSPYLSVLSRDEISSKKFRDQFARHSIISFEVLARGADQNLQLLDESGCRQLFKLLNQDARHLIPSASQKHQALLQQECHIGQPVALGSKKNKRVVLRLVIGMRFFNIIAQNEIAVIDAALESEISDLLRAIEKLEILAEHWWSYCHDLA